MAAKVITIFIKTYQAILSPILHWLSFSFFGAQSGCRFSPICSEYAIETFRDYEFLRAVFLVIRRLGSCR